MKVASRTVRRTNEITAVARSGCGFAERASNGDLGGLGGKLMAGYVRQLGGKMQVIENNGTTIAIELSNLR